MRTIGGNPHDPLRLLQKNRVGTPTRPERRRGSHWPALHLHVTHTTPLLNNASDCRPRSVHGAPGTTVASSLLGRTHNQARSPASGRCLTIHPFKVAGRIRIPLGRDERPFRDLYLPGYHG